jgi:hypothetical protein
MVLDTEAKAYRSNVEDVNRMGRETTLEVTCSWFGI